MSLSKEDVWADLKYALDKLQEPSVGIRGGYDLLDDVTSLDAQSRDEHYRRLHQIGMRPSTHMGGQSRARERDAHEAIEKGLKAVLIDSGMPRGEVRSRGHDLPQLLLDVQQYNPVAFGELERCFDSAVWFVGRVNTGVLGTSIADYLQECGKHEIFISNRYASIEGNKKPSGMIRFLHCEIIRAISLLVFGWTPKDVSSRIEEEATEAIRAGSVLAPTWDVEEWLSLGPVRPRLEVEENLKNKVLLAAVRRCARESKDNMVRYWADELRRERVAPRMEAKRQRKIEKLRDG